MKYTYHFANGDISEIEVTDEDAFALSELDRVDYNNNQRETRRHASLEAINLDDSLLPSEASTESDVLSILDQEQVQMAITQLMPQQQALINRVYTEHQTIASIAKAEGVNEAAIRNRLKKIYGHLKKVLS